MTTAKALVCALLFVALGGLAVVVWLASPAGAAYRRRRAEDRRIVRAIRGRT